MTNWLTEWENKNANAYDSIEFSMKSSEKDFETKTARHVKRK